MKFLMQIDLERSHNSSKVYRLSDVWTLYLNRSLPEIMNEIEFF